MAVKMNIIKARKVVTIAYYTVLNRKPDHLGLNSWANKLRDGIIDEVDLYYELFNSKEYQNMLKKKSSQ